MNTVTVETSDLYFAAFLLAVGAPLASSRYTARGRCVWTFEAQGDDPEKVYLGYLGGAQVSARAMATALVDLKRMALASPAR